jgi:hypothetical protein
MYVLSAHRFMRLDAAASRALNVLPQRLDGSASFSLYGIMARGKTAMGKRLLKVRDMDLCEYLMGLMCHVVLLSLHAARQQWASACSTCTEEGLCILHFAQC